jgi:hypothetical protein
MLEFKNAKMQKYQNTNTQIQIQSAKVQKCRNAKVQKYKNTNIKSL